MKIYDVFSKICYDVYYHILNFQLETPPMHGEMKKKNCTKR